jgi:hypothetical protein
MMVPMRVVLTGGKDAFVYEGDPGLNYGTNAVVEALPISNCNATHCEAFMQFDLSTLPADVESVHLVVKHAPHTTYCYSGCAADFYFAILTGAWDEMTINYNNFPARGDDFYGPVPISFPNDFGTVEYDITDAYIAWKSGQHLTTDLLFIHLRLTATMLRFILWFRPLTIPKKPTAPTLKLWKAAPALIRVHKQHAARYFQVLPAMR